MGASVNLGQIELDVIEGVFSLLGIILTAVAPVMLQRLFQLLAAHHVLVSAQIQATITDELHDAIPRALTYAEHETEGKIDQNKKADIGSPFMAAAINYLVANKGELLQKAGIGGDVDKLRDLIVTHIEPPTSTAGVGVSQAKTN